MNLSTLERHASWIEGISRNSTCITSKSWKFSHDSAAKTQVVISVVHPGYDCCNLYAESVKEYEAFIKWLHNGTRVRRKSND